MLIWKTLTGIVIFLLGIKLLEESLKTIAGRSFKLFLKKQASHQLTAIGSTAIVTGLIQSSSIVNMMILGFVGTDILTMQNALAMMLGANLGTTLNSWIIALLGFKLNIESFTYLVTGIAGIVMFISKEESKILQWSKFLLGFSLLFVGLDLMRTGAEDFVLHTDLQLLKNYPLFVFTFTGIILTAIIQSSAATVAIVLSALFANAISLNMGMAVVLGAETGTTLKLLLASWGGNAAKKRVAMGNFIFNAFTTILILIILQPVSWFITNIAGIKNTLLALVFFQSFINAIMIVVFLPFLKPFGAILEKRFNNRENITRYIDKITVTETDTAIETLEKEISRFLQLIIALCREEFGLSEPPEMRDEKEFYQKTFTGQYEHIKELHGNIYSFYLGLQKYTMGEKTAAKLDMLTTALRNGMYAAKSIKDSYNDIKQLSESSKDIKYMHYQDTGTEIQTALNAIDKILIQPGANSKTEIENLRRLVDSNYANTLKSLYTETGYLSLSEVELSTIINFSKEIYTSQNALILAVEGLVL